MSRPSYKNRDPKGWCGDPKRGAAMGRNRLHNEPTGTYDGKLVLAHVRLSGDYDVNGTYWGGGGPPLFWYANDEGTIDGCVRAANREAAKVKVLEFYPKAKFWR